jgi:competence protein ComFC
VSQRGSAPAYTLYHTLWTAIDWLYPPVCGGCGTFAERWCPECQANTTRLLVNICPRCGDLEPGGSLCPECNANPPAYLQLRSWGTFNGPLRAALLSLKYRNDIGLGEALSRHLSDLYQSQAWKADLIIPVPLGAARQRERGYNQAALLAYPFALRNSIQYLPGALKRSRETRSQVGLGVEQRQQNVSGAFTASPQIAGMTVIVVDDTTTTGATISACASALLQAGAVRVYGLTLARAIQIDDTIITDTELALSHGLALPTR